jgi:glycerol kinase
MIETTAMGAAFLAGKAVGVWKNPRELANARRVERVFSPALAPAEREKLYRDWKSAVARVRTRP